MALDRQDGVSGSGSTTTAAEQLADHLADTVDAHNASAISFVPAGTIAATTVQAAVAEVATDAAARAFHCEPQAIAELAHSLLIGLRQGGVHTVGKHFPGHGYVSADSHHEIPVDERTYTDIELCDLIPFRQMVNFGLSAVMPAHVIYPKVDKHPAGFSEIWLKRILRKELGFEGCIFSDDLAMEGATVAGGVIQRAEAALHAGCDMVLVCNKPEMADELLAGLKWGVPAASKARLAQMRGRPHPETLVQLHERPEFMKALRSCQRRRRQRYAPPCIAVLCAGKVWNKEMRQNFRDGFAHPR